MITLLRLQEFKAFRKASLSMRPLTVLVGENNSGKSSILAALRLLTQTIEASDDTIPLALSGPLGDFGSYRDIVHGHHRGRPLGLGLIVRDERRTDGASYDFLSEFKYRLQRREIYLRSTRLRSRAKPLLTITASPDSDRMTFSSIAGRSVPESARASLRRSLRVVHFLPRPFPDFLGRQSRSPDVVRAIEQLDKVRRQAARATDGIVSTLRGVEFVGAMRQPPERTYVNAGVAGQRIGVDGRNWPALLALERSRGARRSMKYPFGREGIQAWLKEAGLAVDIDVSWLSDRHYEITLTHPLSGETANVADVGQGTSQVLPVIVAGSRMSHGSVFIVEEPEIHLHPRAQAALGDFFADLTLAGVQCLVETHSEYLILRLQQRIAAGDLPSSDVIFYYVSSDDSGKHATALRLDETAAFRGQVPGGFFPERVSEARKLVRARGEAAGRKQA